MDALCLLGLLVLVGVALLIAARSQRSDSHASAADDDDDWSDLDLAIADEVFHSEDE